MSDRLTAGGSALARLRQQGKLWTWFKIALALGLITVVIAQIDLRDLLNLWQSVSPFWLVASTLSYIALLICTARRYWLLIGRKVSFRRTLGLVVLQTAIGNFIATSAGLASYIALLRGRYEVKISHAVGSILISRLADLLLLLLGLAVAAWALWHEIGPLHGVIAVLELGIAGVVVGLTLLILYRNQAVQVIQRALHIAGLDRVAMIQRAAGSLQTMVAPSPRRSEQVTTGVIGFSALIMLFQFGVSYTFIRMVNLPLGGWDVLLVFALGTLISLVPIQVFGGLGVTDLTMLYLYQLLGVPMSLAAPAVVSARLFMYGLNLLSLLYLPFDTSSKPDQPGAEQQLDAGRSNGPF